MFHDGETFVSKPPPEDTPGLTNASILYMDGAEHRRYPALVQPSFLPKPASWWTERWVVDAIDALLDRMEPNGSADLNVEFFSTIRCSPSPGASGCRWGRPSTSAKRSPPTDSASRRSRASCRRSCEPDRDEPRDDLISVLVAAEITEEDGSTHRLTDEEVLIFAFILLAAGSGTTWKQMGITMLALFDHPDWLAAVRDDRAQLRPVVEESLRWMPTDPMFSRFVARDAELAGTAVPEGAVVHMCLAAANRDPARWERPDQFDPGRPVQPHMGFGTGAHICLGSHVARAELVTAIGALLDRFPDLRLDDDAPAPRITGMYERGPTSVPVAVLSGSWLQGVEVVLEHFLGTGGAAEPHEQGADHEQAHAHEDRVAHPGGEGLAGRVGEGFAAGHTSPRVAPRWPGPRGPVVRPRRGDP